MAKPYLIFKAHTGVYYAQILLPDGSHTNNKSTGCRNRADAERKVMEWIVTGTIPARINSSIEKTKTQTIEKVKIFNELRNTDFDTDDIKKIIKILKDRNFIQAAVLKNSQGSIPIEKFLDEFWDYEKSPYVIEKLSKNQSIGKHHVKTYHGRITKYWIPRLTGKCVGEITKKDVEAFFTSDEAKLLSPKTVNEIINTITIPLKWAYFHEMTLNNCFDGIIKCSGKSKERKILTMDVANKLMEVDWDNDIIKLANELAMHTGLRNGELKALTPKSIGNDEIFVTQAWGKYDHLKCCKNGEERQVPIPIPHSLTLKLKALAQSNPFGENEFLFYSTIPGKPLEDRTLNKYLRRALESIGYENPKEISFYSWRHFFCSRMMDYITDKRIVMALSGHKTEAMLNHYAKHLEDDRVVTLARDVMKKVFIDKNEDAETIQNLNRHLEALNEEFSKQSV